MSTILPFKDIQIKHDDYRCKDCMKKTYNSLRKHALKLINFLKKNGVIYKGTAGVT